MFKVCGDVLSKTAPNALSLAKSYYYAQHEPTQIAAFRLLQVLVPFSTIKTNKIVNIAVKAFKYCKTPFASDENSHLAALCAVVPYIHETVSDGNDETQDFVVKGKTKKDKVSPLPNSFAVLRKFMNNFSTVFSRFLDLLSPEFIFKNAKELIDFALDVSPADHGKVTAFFARDVRGEILNNLIMNKNTPFNLLKSMTFDVESARLVANIAYKKIWGTNAQDKYNAGLFLSLFQILILNKLTNI